MICDTSHHMLRLLRTRKRGSIPRVGTSPEKHNTGAPQDGGPATVSRPWLFWPWRENRHWRKDVRFIELAGIQVQCSLAACRAADSRAASSARSACARQPLRSCAAGPHCKPRFRRSKGPRAGRSHGSGDRGSAVRRGAAPRAEARISAASRLAQRTPQLLDLDNVDSDTVFCPVELPAEWPGSTAGPQRGSPPHSFTGSFKSNFDVAGALPHCTGRRPALGTELPWTACCSRPGPGVPALPCSSGRCSESTRPMASPDSAQLTLRAVTRPARANRSFVSMPSSIIGYRDRDTVSRDSPASESNLQVEAADEPSR
jgi:hypothetical protein